MVNSLVRVRSAIEWPRPLVASGPALPWVDNGSRYHGKDDPELAEELMDILAERGRPVCAGRRCAGSPLENDHSVTIQVEQGGGNTHHRRQKRCSLPLAEGRMLNEPRARSGGGGVYPKWHFGKMPGAAPMFGHIYAGGRCLPAAFSLPPWLKHTAKIALPMPLMKIPMKTDVKHLFPWSTVHRFGAGPTRGFAPGAGCCGHIVRGL